MKPPVNRVGGVVKIDSRGAAHVQSLQSGVKLQYLNRGNVSLGDQSTMPCSAYQRRRPQGARPLWDIGEADRLGLSVAIG